MNLYVQQFLEVFLLQQFLPPYSPDFNPIEHQLAAVKHAIRKTAEAIKNFYDAAVQALGNMCMS